MSIRQAIASASKEALAAYLSPELCEQLSDEIVHRAQAELEGALSAFVGFDFARAGAPKARAAQAAGKVATGRRGRKPRAERETHSENLVRDSNETHSGEQEPSPDQMV